MARRTPEQKRLIAAAKSLRDWLKANPDACLGLWK
jgi:hypothetical protein